MSFWFCFFSYLDVFEQSVIFIFFYIFNYDEWFLKFLIRKHIFFLCVINTNMCTFFKSCLQLIEINRFFFNRSTNKLTYLISLWKISKCLLHANLNFDKIDDIQLCFDLIEDWIRKNPKASICTAEGVNEFKNVANFQDYHGFPEFRKVYMH